MKPSVYLAGPITGLSWEEITGWRDQVTKAFEPDIDCFSPLRGKKYLANETSIKDSYDKYVMSTQRGILVRDHYDATRRSLLFVNLLSAVRVSVGTVMEIAWAHEARVPIVLCMQANVIQPGMLSSDPNYMAKNPHDHSMIREACPLTVDSLEEGIHVAKHLLLPNF
jgi:hypothetical protein